MMISIMYHHRNMEAFNLKLWRSKQICPFSDHRMHFCLVTYFVVIDYFSIFCWGVLLKDFNDSFKIVNFTLVHKILFIAVPP